MLRSVDVRRGTPELLLLGVIVIMGKVLVWLLILIVVIILWLLRLLVVLLLLLCLVLLLLQLLLLLLLFLLFCLLFVDVYKALLHHLEQRVIISTSNLDTLFLLFFLITGSRVDFGLKFMIGGGLILRLIIVIARLLMLLLLGRSRKIEVEVILILWRWLVVLGEKIILLLRDCWLLLKIQDGIFKGIVAGWGLLLKRLLWEETFQKVDC